MKAILATLVLLGFPLGALAQVVPNFMRGTVDTSTTTKTKIVESIKQVEYSTGNIYTVSATNINIPDNPRPGANYTIQTQGAPFQFSETNLGPGISKETWIDRVTEQESFSKSLSVFAQ